MPSAKFALVFASRALACACSASNSWFFALSCPDLDHVSQMSISALGEIHTFAPALQDCDPTEVDCKFARGGHSCSRANPRSWRRSRSSHTRCRHIGWKHWNRHQRQTLKHSPVALVATPSIGCNLTNCGCALHTVDIAAACRGHSLEVSRSAGIGSKL